MEKKAIVDPSSSVAATTPVCHQLLAQVWLRQRQVILHVERLRLTKDEEGKQKPQEECKA